MEELANVISQYGFPLIAACGMAYFIYFIWQWVTKTIDPVIAQAQGTLIALVDRVRMLDNDMIRLNTKLSMVLEYKDEIEQASGQKLDIDDILTRNKSFSEGFDSTGKK